MNGNEAAVKLLLATGQVDPDSKDSYGQTTLLWAVAKGNEAIVNKKNNQSSSKTQQKCQKMYYCESVYVSSAKEEKCI